MQCPTWSKGSVIMFVCCVMVFGANRAHAYIDPGTGSYLLQLAIGAVFAAAFLVRGFWSKIKATLTHALRRPGGGDDE